MILRLFQGKNDTFSRVIHGLIIFFGSYSFRITFDRRINVNELVDDLKHGDQDRKK